MEKIDRRNFLKESADELLGINNQETKFEYVDPSNKKLPEGLRINAVRIPPKITPHQ